MKTPQDPQSIGKSKLSLQTQHESKGEQNNYPVTEAPVTDSGSISSSNGNDRKVSREDIELVQNLIERCLQLYMSRAEVVGTLQNRARIEPGFTTLVWQKLEEENPEFFRAYYIRLKLKKQIILFNSLLQHQYHLMKYPVQQNIPMAPMQNGIHPMPVNNLPMGYPVLQQPPMPAAGQPHLDSMNRGLSSCHVVNGIPAPGNFHSIRIASGNESVMNGNASEVAPPFPPCSGMSDMAVSPASVASNGHFPFTPSDMSGVGMDTSALDTAFTSDVASSEGLQLGLDNGAGCSKDNFHWDFSLSDLTADLTNLEDLGALENYPHSPFLHSDLDSPEQDDIVNEFFADSVAPCTQSDEDKS